MSRTTKHSGAIKALQFNPKHSNLLATGGAKGELFISDLNNLENPFRLGNNAARTDDIDCLDWNKKVPHILVTGSSAGFVTVWDVKTKKESLTLNNMGRKAVSAVSWDPEKVQNTMLLIDALLVLLRNVSSPLSSSRRHRSSQTHTFMSGICATPTPPSGYVYCPSSKASDANMFSTDTQGPRVRCSFPFMV